MARKGGRGGNKAARSAAAKKGWETRRRGGAKSKPAATKRTAASKPRNAPVQPKTSTKALLGQAADLERRAHAKSMGASLNMTKEKALRTYKEIKALTDRAKGLRAQAQLTGISKAASKRRGMPKTTTARGRALTNQRRAADLVRASRGGKGPSAKAVRSVLTAQRARAFYAATGGGKKRSAVKAKSAAKVGKQIRAQGRAKATAARAKVAGRPRAGATVARPKGVKVTQEQRAIATAMKKSVRSKNIQASRILMKMAARDGHGGDIRGLTSTVASNGRGGWKAVPTRNQRGNQMSAEKNKELMFDRAPSRRLMRAAMNAADAGRVSQRRLDAVLKASGIDYMAINQGYWRAVDSAKGAFSRRRRRG